MLDTRARINLFDLPCVQVCATRGHGRRAARAVSKKCVNKPHDRVL